MTGSAFCLFCAIIEKQIPAKIVYEDERAIAFEDKYPQAPVHLLIVPRIHIRDVGGVTEAEEPLVGHLFSIAAKLAAQMNLVKDGYRLITNTGAGAGQTVFHLHLHLLAGHSFGSHTR